MRYFFNALNASMVFVGTVVGAGFASGKEINLYFGAAGMFAPVISGVISGILSILFLFLGYYGKGGFLHGKILSKFIYTAAVISYAAMCAGSDVILARFGIKFGGVICAVIVMVAVWLGLNKILVVNNVLQPTIIVLIGVLFFARGNYFGTGNIGVLSALFYSLMNILVAGCILEETGGKLKRKEIYMSGVITALIMSGITLAVYLTVKNAVGEMPLLAVADGLGLGIVAGIVIFVAILSTMLFSAYVIFSKTATKSGKLPALLILSVISSVAVFIGFDNLVNYGYPIVSALGFFITAFAVYVYIKEIFSRRKRMNLR